MRGKWTHVVLTAAVLVSTVGCAALGVDEAPTATPEGPAFTPTAQAPGPGELAVSAENRVTSPDVSDEDLETRVEGYNAFAFDLYQIVREQEGNVFYSPYSIALTVAMAYAGAGGETETQMAEALNYQLPQDRLHQAINALALSLASRSAEEEDDPGRRFRLIVANAAWGQSGYSFLEEYLDVLGRYYGTGLRLLDFESDPEGAREAINNWVSDRTAGLIDELIPEGIINTMTRLVLTNAVYFRASWMHPFDDANTTDDTFELLDGSEITTLFMEQTEEFDYTEGDGYQAVELPYVGDEVSMVVVAPEPERFAEFEEALNSDRAASIIDDLERTNVTLSMPLFEFSSDLPLSDALKEMGMTAAFSPEEADFSGIDGTMRLFIRDVLHKGFVSVDESGTEAAAATAVVVEEESLPPEPVEMEIDSPFIFMIRDTETGTILFVGRVVSPEAHVQVR